MEPATISVGPDESHALARDGADTALLEFVSNRDVPCPLCHYNLRGLTIPRCPECGNGVRLTVGLVEVRMGAWICALSAILPAAPFGLLLGYILLKNGLPPVRQLGQLGPGQIWAVALLIYAMLAVPGSALLLALRRKYIRLPGRLQWLLAGVAISIDIAAAITFLVEVR